MTTDQHIQFLRKMIAEMQSQIADLEAQQKTEFDAKQIPLIEDGWIEWHGGSCPVEPRSLVMVKFRDDNVVLKPDPAYTYRWSAWGSPGDIVSYKVAV